MMNRWSLLVTALLLLLGALAPAERPAEISPPPGLFVEAVKSGSAAEDAGILPGDILLSWERPAAPPHAPEPARGTFRSLFDLEAVAAEQTPRGTVWLSVLRDGERLRLEAPPGVWELTVRPRLVDVELRRYLALAEHPAADGWRRLAARSEAAGRQVEAWWLLARGATRLGAGGDWRSARELLNEAAGMAAAAGEDEIADHLRARLGGILSEHGRLGEAEAAFAETLGRLERRAPESIHLALTLEKLAVVAWMQGKLDTARANAERARSLFHRLAPDSLEASLCLTDLGLLAEDRGDLARAERYHREAVAVQERRIPGSIRLAQTRTNLAAVLATAREYELAEEHFQRAHAIFAERTPDGENLANSFSNLSELAALRGDDEAAERYARQALRVLRAVAPGGRFEANILGQLGFLALRRGELEVAARYGRQALAIQEEEVPDSLDVSYSLELLAKVAAESGELAEAEALYRQVLERRQRFLPGAACDSCYRLAGLCRATGRPAEALELYARAVDTLDAQREQLGSSHEARARFSGEHANYYRDYLDLLLEFGRPEEAFHVLERYRARSFLALLAERDLRFRADIPPSLERERRLANAHHDRVLREQLELGDGAAERLAEARRRQDEVAAKIRAASPRLASLKYPRPLDLAATWEVLDPGTLLLSYSVGEEKSHLFLVGPERGAFRVVPLAAGEGALRDEVERFRALLLAGRLDPRREKLLLQAGELGRLLLAPAAPEIARAERLLILADGPLHSLPFSALADPTAPAGRYLAEAKPLAVAASATVFALAKRERRPRDDIRLVAFGESVYPASAALDAVAPELSVTLRSGFRLTPLPASGAEVRQIRELFPGQARVYLGAEASEERAKAVGGTATHLHFACHGLLNDRSPLDSALALSIPATWSEGEDNGLLQAWEILEQMRLDAELVTLSACDTARGEVVAGEGLMGLTRAFQYAGARSVLASLWSVSDRSTAELMARFYRYLKQGESKAEALRRARLDLLRRSPYAHPFHWAGFELLGDWR